MFRLPRSIDTRLKGIRSRSRVTKLVFFGAANASPIGSRHARFYGQSNRSTPSNRPFYAVTAILTGLGAGIGAYLLGQGGIYGSGHVVHSYGGKEALAKAKEELMASSLPVLDDPRTLETYGFSPNSYHAASPHNLVVKVYSTEDVVRVVNTSRKYRIPITPYSGGTSLEGHFGGVLVFPLAPILSSNCSLSSIAKRSEAYASTCLG